MLGWIDPAYFLGGLLTLDADGLAPRARRRSPTPLGMSVEEAAYAALTIATENVIGAIREITIAQGIDPREYSLVAGGGASGLNVVPIARELGSKRVLLPSTAGALSACGALFSDVISEFSRSRYAETRTLDPDAVNEVLADIEARADAFLADLADIDPVATRKEFTVEARYRAQIWELDVPIPSRIRDGGVRRAGGRVPRDARARLRRARAGPVPRVPALEGARDGRAAQARACTRAPRPPGAPEPALVAPAYFRETGLVPVPNYDGVTLPRGARIEGPALIREPTTTVVAYPGSDASRSSRARQLPAGGAAVSLDPVLLAVIANRMDSIVREMENTLLRSGRSAVLNQARDFSCALVTGDARLLASAEGLPVHVIGMEFLAQAVTDLHDDIARRRRLPAQRPLPRQHAPGRPRHPRAGHLGGRPPLHGGGEGASGRLRQLPADDLHALRARRLRGRQPDLPGRARAARLRGHRRHHPHVPPPHPRAGAVVRRLPGDARRRAHRRGAAQGAVREVRPRDAERVRRGVVRLLREPHRARDLATCARA